MSGSTIGDFMVRVGSDVKGLQSGMGTVRREMQATERQGQATIKGFSASGTIIGAGLMGAASSGIAYAMKSVDTYKSLGKEMLSVQRMTGATASQASLITGEMKLIGGETVNAGDAMAFFAKNLGQAQMGGGPALATFSKLGVNLKDTNGQWRTGADVLIEFRDKLSGVTNESQRAADASAVMGRSYKNILPWFTKSADDINKMNEELKSMGFGMSDAQMAKFKSIMGDEKKFALYQQQLQFRTGELTATFEDRFLPVLDDVIGGLLMIPGPVLQVAGDLAILIGVLKGGQMMWVNFIKPIGQMKGLLGANTIAEAAETVAVEANTVAWGENAAARAFAYSMGGGAGTKGAGLVNGIGRNALPLGEAAGAAALGSFGTSAAAIAVIASTAMAGAFIYTLSTYNQPGGSPSGTTVSGQGAIGGRGPGSGMAGAQIAAASRARIDREVAGMQQLNDIIKQINALKPGAATVGATTMYSNRLKDLAKQYPEIAGQIHEVNVGLGKNAEAFNTAAQAAADAAKAIHEAYSSMDDFLAATTQAALMGTPLPTADQAAFASQSSQATAFAAAQKAAMSGQAAPNKSLKLPAFNTYGQRLAYAKQHGISVDQMPLPSGGTSNQTAGGSAGTKSGRDVVVNVHIGSVVGTDERAARQLSEMIGRQLSRGVMRQLVGQNA